MSSSLLSALSVPSHHPEGSSSLCGGRTSGPGGPHWLNERHILCVGHTRVLGAPQTPHQLPSRPPYIRPMCSKTALPPFRTKSERMAGTMAGPRQHSVEWCLRAKPRQPSLSPEYQCTGLQSVCENTPLRMCAHTHSNTHSNTHFSG